MASHLKQDGDRSKIEVYPYLSPAQIFIKSRASISTWELHSGTLGCRGVLFIPVSPSGVISSYQVNRASSSASSRIGFLLQKRAEVVARRLESSLTRNQPSPRPI